MALSAFGSRSDRATPRRYRTTTRFAQYQCGARHVTPLTHRYLFSSSAKKASTSRPKSASISLTSSPAVSSLRHRGLTILQSTVILDYLARESGHFEGRTEQERWQAREWLSWEADHITYVAKVRHSARFRASHPETIAEYRPRTEAALSFVDNAVKDQPFLVGDHCTIADIGCWGRMVFMAEGGFDIDNWPHLAAWAGRLKAMPGFALPYELIPSKDREFDPA